MLWSFGGNGSVYRNHVVLSLRERRIYLAARDDHIKTIHHRFGSKMGLSLSEVVMFEFRNR